MVCWLLIQLIVSIISTKIYHRHEQVNIFCQNLLIKSFTTKIHTGLVYKSLGHAVNQLLIATTFFFKLIKDKMVHIEKFFQVLPKLTKFSCTLIKADLQNANCNVCTGIVLPCPMTYECWVRVIHYSWK